MQKLQDKNKIFSYLSYTDNYELYLRPGMKVFDDSRYRRYAEWIGKYFPEAPSRIIEAGCGMGWILDIVQSAHPKHRFEGLEPAASACEAAAAGGVRITQGMLGDADSKFAPASFDMAYSINVVEHTADPAAFLREMARIVKPGGAVLAICPNSDVISSESLYIDHLFSIRRDNLQALFLRAGLKAVHWEAGSLGGMEDLQLLFGVVDAPAQDGESYSVPEALLQARRDYFSSWSALDARLMDRLGDARSVVCFGAGETSDMMAFYAPQTWARVGGHAIDRMGQDKPERYRSLPLYFLDEVPDDATLLLGTKQHYQPKLYERLSEHFSRVVRWDDIVAG